MGATSCNYLLNHHWGKHCWTALILSGFSVTATVCTVSSATFYFPFLLSQPSIHLNSAWRAEQWTSGFCVCNCANYVLGMHVIHDVQGPRVADGVSSSRSQARGRPPVKVRDLVFSNWLNSHPRGRLFYRSGSRTPASLTEETALNEGMNLNG